MRPGRLHIYLIYTAIGLFAASLILNKTGSNTPASLAVKASLLVNERINECKTALDLVDSLNAGAEQVRNLFIDKQIGIYRFRKDSLVEWNNAQWPLNENLEKFSDTTGVIKLSYAWFIYAKKQKGDLTSLAISLIKPAYRIQNTYLSNDFAKWLGLPGELDLEYPASSENRVLAGSKVLFSLKAAEENYPDQDTNTTQSFLIVAALITLMLALLLRLRQNSGPSILVMSILLVTALRLLMLIFHVPESLYRSGMYDPALFGNADSFMNGFIGDLFLNGLVYLFISAALHIYPVDKAGRSQKIIVALFLFLLSLFLVYQFNKILLSLVSNSTFNFNFLSILSLHPMLALGLTGPALLALSLFVCLHKLFIASRQINRSSYYLWGLILISPLVFFISGWPWLESCWFPAFALIVYLSAGGSKPAFATGLGLQVLFITALISGLLNRYVEKNQLLELEILTQSLGERQDRILESEFEGLNEKIKNDESLQNLVNFLPDSEKEIQQILRQKYFNGYFDRYEIGFSIFDKNCLPLLSSDDPVLLNEGYFKDRIEYMSTMVGEDVYFVNGHRKNAQYLVKIEKGVYRLYARLDAKQNEEVGSFPDLFLDRSLQKQQKLRHLNYAVYRDGQNTNRYGEVNYPYFFSDSLSLSKSTSGFAHYYFEPEENTRVIISRAARTGAYFFTFNSYLLLFFSLLTYCVYLVYAILFTAQFQTASLTRRIQTIIIALLLLAMSAVGITSGNLVSGQFDKGNRRQLEEKTRVIVSELTIQPGAAKLFDEAQKDLLNARIREYSRLFSTPVSLFDRNGKLFTTSEPKLYDYAFAAAYINPQAFEELQNNISSAVCLNEKAGRLNYLSLYTPLYNSRKELIGFINLPYFTKQGDLANELSEIISALINVYVILFVLSILAGLILSGYITRPLRLIKQQIARITLGQKNEKINWQSNDEIGRLVAEYNQMLLKLEESASLLAKSERESAWREMAKQVAHEIKNPLTPMKLNLQYLQHLIKSNPGDFKERFEKASSGIIEQIDALAAIATEFSNFARLPGAQLHQQNLVDIVKAAVTVFDAEEKTKIIHHAPLQDVNIMCDREQCLRVFNNVLKNAVQATEGADHARIEINYSIKENDITVLVSDNGCGIDEEMKPKIFTPNFTTKNTGTGLGLAMVKNIMEGFGGAVNFESEKGKGTVFRLLFKKQ